MVVLLSRRPWSVLPVLCDVITASVCLSVSVAEPQTAAVVHDGVDMHQGK